MAQVEVKINSVNFICDWEYVTPSGNLNCCFCIKNCLYDLLKSQQSKIKVKGLVIGKCGHVADFTCYKYALRNNNKNGEKMYCGICHKDGNNVEFVFDKNLEEPHTQQLYKV